MGPRSGSELIGGLVRGHDQTIGRARPLRKGRPGPIVAWLLATLLQGVAHVAAPAAEPIRIDASAASPIDLAAERLRVWEDGPVRWAMLEGQSAILQGVEGVRAGRILVRYAPAPGDPAGEIEVEAYAEGDVTLTDRPGVSPKPLRLVFRTTGEVRFKPYSERGFEQLASPPRLPLIARAFPEAAEESAVAAPDPDAPAAVHDAEAAPELPQLPPPADAPAGAEAADLPAPAETREALAEFEPEELPELPQAIEIPRLDAPEEGQGPPAGELPPADSALLPTQFEGEPFGGGFNMDQAPGPDPSMGSAPDADPSPTDLMPLPAEDAPFEPEEEDGMSPARPADEPEDVAPIIPGTQRLTTIEPRDGATPYSIQTEATRPDGTMVTHIRGGMRMVTSAPNFGVLDIEADNAVIFRKSDPASRSFINDKGQEVTDAKQPMSVYLQGNVIVRQDERTIVGNGDQKIYKGEQVYLDLVSERVVIKDGEIKVFVPGLIAPITTKAPQIDQFRPLERFADGTLGLGLPEIRAQAPTTSGSRFPTPGYRFNSRTIDLSRVESTTRNPRTGNAVGNPKDPNAPRQLTWRFDARQNFFYIGAFPVFYWPRVVGDADSIEPPLRQIGFRANNYFGQQVLTDWDGFKVFGLKKPNSIDNWNIDLDYLSARGVAAGSELGWFGRELVPGYASEYFGYFDLWGLRDSGMDVLGGGPAVITDTDQPPTRLGYQRTSVPPGEKFRGRILARHMQSLLTDDSDPLDDFRLQLEGAYVSDRYFLEQYYKRLNETGLDQSTLAYLIWSRRTSAFTILTEANLQNFNTETQWLPRFDYYRIGDGFFGGRLNYYQHSGANYANVHTASEVNNPNPFNLTPDSPIRDTAFLPYDPTSNTTGAFKSGRLFTAHELDAPLNFDFLRVVPYAQGQAIGWNNQINQTQVGRLWGAVGARAEIMAWRAYADVDNELLNIHGLNHKINFMADYRTAYSTQRLNSLGVQDDIDDNTYEFVRRYFALTQYAGGILPAQYDPRLLITRRTLSPITGTNDLQDSMQTVHLGIHQRLQTKRGPEGARRIIDWMTFDLDTTYFPLAERDNFGKPFGQNRYNYEWFLGDRTSLVSSGWLEFFDIEGQSLNKVNPRNKNNPFGLEMINVGLAIARPPSASIYLGYYIINSGVINTSALNAMYSYQMSPKWFSTASTSYDFGNAQLLGAMFSVTRIGADYLTTVGLSVDPQRRSYTFGVELVPRLSPTLRLGSVGGGMNRFDPRYAPTQ